MLAHLGGNEMWDDVEEYWWDKMYILIQEWYLIQYRRTVLTDRTYAWC